MTKIVLLAHGSPDPRSGEAILRFAEKIQSRISQPTVVAFLDHEKPSLSDIAKKAGGDEVLVVPMLLSNAFHARFDVPRAMTQAGLTKVLAPIGHPLEILTSLIKAAGPNALVVAAGSTDARARQLFQDAVDLACLGSGISALSAFITGSDLDLESQLSSIQSCANSNTKVIPWLLAEGRLLDAILSKAKDYGASVQGGGLVEETLFLEHVSASIQKSLLSESYPELVKAR